MSTAAMNYLDKMLNENTDDNKFYDEFTKHFICSYGESKYNDFIAIKVYKKTALIRTILIDKDIYKRFGTKYPQMRKLFNNAKTPHLTDFYSITPIVAALIANTKETSGDHVENCKSFANDEEISSLSPDNIEEKLAKHNLALMSKDPKAADNLVEILSKTKK